MVFSSPSIENAPELEELLPPKGGPCFKFSTEDDGENTQGHTLSIELNTMRIENAPELEELLPPKGGPCFNFSTEDDGENTQGHALSIELNTLVRGKKTVGEIISWIEENVITVNGHKVAVEVVIQTLLDIGLKSFTHLMTVLERYGHIISKLFPYQDTQVMLIDEICLYWKNNTQNAAITIDRMMGYRLISNFVIIIWVCLPFNISQFHLSDHPQEIWSHMERLESEVFGEGVHPLFRKAVYAGLGGPE